MHRGFLVDRSGTIAVGGTSQQLAPLNNARRFLFIQNASSADLWIDFDVPAVEGAPSQLIAPGDSYTWDHFVPQSAINIIGNTTGQAFVCKVAT